MVNVERPLKWRSNKREGQVIKRRIACSLFEPRRVCIHFELYGLSLSRVTARGALFLNRFAAAFRDPRGLQLTYRTKSFFEEN